jgi:hypothetical protein
MRAALCVLVAFASACLFATASLAAKSKPPVAAKYKASKNKASLAAKQPSVEATPRTPVDKDECIAVSQAFYRQAKTISKQANQTIPPEFMRVVTNLDVSCGEEEFEKARASIDWMNTCLENFTQDRKLGFCSRNSSYFCAVDPRSNGCQSQ